MRIERVEEGDLRVRAVLDGNETRALSRSVDAIPGWLSAAHARLSKGTEGGIVAAFPDEATLGAFMGRFLPGQTSRGRGGAILA